MGWWFSKLRSGSHWCGLWWVYRKVGVGRVLVSLFTLRLGWEVGAGFGMTASVEITR